jgi:hypothetical protein
LIILRSFSYDTALRAEAYSSLAVSGGPQCSSQSQKWIG